ncbi:MAG: DNA polymerase IV, partial [Bacillota bacterium]|nr:DNA polymerase IV [Bacillota bacterium]
MDAFYAAVEQRDNPQLRGKPVIVGGEPNSRGVVSTCSYEARRYGIKSAMPIFQAQKLCPEAIFLRPRFNVYQQVAEKIREIFCQFTPLVECISIDEAFLDVTGSLSLFGSPQHIGQQIKLLIKESLELTASVGIANNKFLAKLASDLEKPNGFKIILRHEA